MVSHTKIDKINISLIRALQKDARTNFAEIAKNCDVSTDTISKRFRKLKKTGVIREATLLLNPTTFGQNCVASLEIDVDHLHVNQVVDAVRKIPDVVCCIPSMGRHDIFTIAVLENVSRLGEVKEFIKGHPLVRRVTTTIWVDQMLLGPQNFEFSHLEKLG